MATTSIEWCDFTFNPWSGCSKVHAGCANCYAEVNYSVKMRGVKWGPQGNRIRASEAMWREPLKWNRQAEKAGERRKVFCASLADVFEDWDGPILDSEHRQLFREYSGAYCYSVDQPHEPMEHAPGVKDFPAITMNDLRRDLFALIDQTPNLDWLLLTKRPENIRSMWLGLSGRSNVWLGSSPCDQKTFDDCLPDLLGKRNLCRFLFLSLEPLLGPIILPKTKVVDWVIVGGESGPKARPCDIDWIRSIRDQCRAAGVPCFVKQLGSYVLWSGSQGGYGDGPSDCWPRNESTSGAEETFQGRTRFRKRLLDDKGGNLLEMPEDLRVREFPKSKSP